MPDSIDAVLREAITRIVRSELASTESRLEARLDGVADDLRSEIRALRRQDEALDARLTVTTQRVDAMDAMNQEIIRLGVRQAMGEMFSIKRLAAGLMLVMGLITTAINLSDKVGKLFF